MENVSIEERDRIMEEVNQTKSLKKKFLEAYRKNKESQNKYMNQNVKQLLLKLISSDFQNNTLSACKEIYKMRNNVNEVKEIVTGLNNSEAEFKEVRETQVQQYNSLKTKLARRRELKNKLKAHLDNYQINETCKQALLQFETNDTSLKEHVRNIQNVQIHYERDNIENTEQIRKDKQEIKDIIEMLGKKIIDQFEMCLKSCKKHLDNIGETSIDLDEQFLEINKFLPNFSVFFLILNVYNIEKHHIQSNKFLDLFKQLMIKIAMKLNEKIEVKRDSYLKQVGLSKSKPNILEKFTSKSDIHILFKCQNSSCITFGNNISDEDSQSINEIYSKLDQIKQSIDLKQNQSLKTSNSIKNLELINQIISIIKIVFKQVEPILVFMQEINVGETKINQMLSQMLNQLQDLAGSRIDRIKNIQSILMLLQGVNLFKRSFKNILIEVLLSNIENQIYNCGSKLINKLKENFENLTKQSDFRENFENYLRKITQFNLFTQFLMYQCEIENHSIQSLSKELSHFIPSIIDEYQTDYAPFDQDIIKCRRYFDQLKESKLITTDQSRHFYKDSQNDNQKDQHGIEKIDKKLKDINDQQQVYKEEKDNNPNFKIDKIKDNQKIKNNLKNQNSGQINQFDLLRIYESNQNKYSDKFVNFVLDRKINEILKMTNEQKIDNLSEEDKESLILMHKNFIYTMESDFEEAKKVFEVNAKNQNLLEVLQIKFVSRQTEQQFDFLKTFAIVLNIDQNEELRISEKTRFEKIALHLLKK